MKWNISSKIIGGFSLIVIVIIIIGVTSYTSVEKLNKSAEWVTHTYKVIESFDNLYSDLFNIETMQKGYSITGIESYLEPYNTKINEIDKKVKELNDLIIDDFTKQKFNVLEPLITDRINFLNHGIELRKKEGMEATITYIKQGKGKAIMDNIEKLMQEIDDSEKQLLEAREADSQQTANNTKFVVIIGLFAGIIVTGILGFILSRNISDPIKQIIIFADKIANGDLSLKIPSTTRQDEVGILMGSFGIMLEKLKIINNQINIQLKEGINILASASSEILAATTQLATSTAETATSVTETSTTVEEVKQTSIVAAQKAKYVSESANKP